MDPVVPKTIDVIDPSTEQPFATLAVGSAADVEKAVAAAKRAFPSFSTTSREQRLAWLRALLAAYNARYDDIAEAVSREMGARLSPFQKMRRPGPVAPTSRRPSRRSRTLFSLKTEETPVSSRRALASRH